MPRPTSIEEKELLIFISSLNFIYSIHYQYWKGLNQSNIYLSVCLTAFVNQNDLW